MQSWPLLGALTRDGETEFRVWAPEAGEVAVRIHGSEHPLAREDDGCWSAHVTGTGAGDEYLYVVGGHALPDPCSRFQPHGIRGASQVVEAERGSLLGVSLDELVVYELHVGAFSPSGTFDGVAERLNELRELGVTAIELMPIATFSGNRNWGYDGVYNYAPHPVYGGPAGLRRLVEAAMRRGWP
jgi:maltooligosyltrehalose trehalohydrolase